ETHLVLRRAGRGAAHLPAARRLLERLSRHLVGPDLARFWRRNRMAQALLLAEEHAGSATTHAPGDGLSAADTPVLGEEGEGASRHAPGDGLSAADTLVLGEEGEGASRDG